MDKVTIDKKLLLLLISVILIGVLSYSLLDTSISKSFYFTDEELDYLNNNSDLDIGITDHFLWSKDNLNRFKEQVLTDLGLNINFKLISDGNNVFYHMPLARYQSPDEPVAYQGDFLSPENKLVNRQDMSPLKTDAGQTMTSILGKVMFKYDQDGLIDKWLHESNKILYQENRDYYLDQLLGDTLRVGIEELPGISLVLNQNIYGLSIAYLNNFIESAEMSIEYTIGLEDKLHEIFDDSLDVLLTTKKTDFLFYSEPLVIISTFDESYYESFQDKAIPARDLSFLNENYQTSYYQVPLSLYQMIERKFDKDHFYLNAKLTLTMDYYLLIKEPYKEMFLKYDELVDKDRLLELSYVDIPDEKQSKMNLTWFIVGLSIFIFLLVVYLVVRILLNINEKQRLNYLFKHDQLTYLFNGYGLKKVYRSLNKKTGVLMLLDLRRFKLLNDTLGTDVGDQILIALANIFKTIDRDLIVARTSGDQFTFLSTHKDYQHLLDKIMQSFESYKDQHDFAQKLDLSLCYLPFPEYGDDYNTLIQYLESCMYYAKSEKIINKWVAFNHDIYQAYLKEQEMALDIQNAIDNEEFELHYQPQTELYHELTIGAEVLVRWTHKKKGRIFPDQFLGAAERNGLMRQLDMYMIKKACEQIKSWQDLGYEKMKISVNMSTYTFESRGMSDELLAIIKESKIDTSWFAIEITEESGFTNLKSAKEVMDIIKEEGVRFALDDFGKGYSSLSYLEQIPFDFLKIDKAFVDHIHTSEKSKELYHLITSLAKLYDIHIIAEGVEYLEQINVIKEDMETIIQGYYYSKPLPLKDFDERIKNQTT